VNPVIAAAIIHDDYDSGGSDYTVTQLIDAPYHVRQMTRPEMRDVEVDVVDRLYSLFGRSLHHILERGAQTFEEQRGSETELRSLYPNHGFMSAEVRVFHEVEYEGKTIKVSGQYDLYYKELHRFILEDHKIVSVDEYAHNRSEKKWEQQLNLLALLMRLNGKVVDEVAINCYYRDWSRAKAHFGKSVDYPKAQHLRVILPLWTLSRQNEFLKERLDYHMEYGDTPCSAEERWNKSGGYAVIPAGSPKAQKVCATRDEAESYIGDKLMKAKPQDRSKWMLAEIEPREGTSLRCLLYCDAAPICPYWQKVNER
jgi:hypothetical protein